MTKTVLLTCRPERYQQLAAEVSAWTFDRSAEGWTVRVLQTSAVSGYGLRADLAVQPAFDHLFLLGNLPTIWVTLNPDGHGAHLMPARSFLSNKNVGIDNARDGATDNCGLSSVITKAYAHVGQLNFDGLAGFTEDQITEQYKRWFARRHDLTVNGFKAFTIQSTLHNYFGDSFGPWTIAQFAKFSKSLKYVQIIDDGLLAKQEAALASGIFTGGENYGDGQFLWFVGKYVDLIRMPPQSAIFHCFGSHMGETYTAGSMVRAALVDSPGTGFKDCKVVASIYNHGGRFSFSTLLNGGTGGEAATATEQSIGFPMDYWNGDPTITLDADTLARLAANEQGADVTQAELDAFRADFDAKYFAMDARVKKLEDSGTDANPPPALLAWNLGGPDLGIYKVATATGGVRCDAPPVVISVVGLLNAAPAGVYSTGWSGLNFTVNLSGIAPGKYTLTLHGCECWYGSSGQRVQDFTVNGALLFPAVDWYVRAGGQNKAATVSAPVTIGADGKLAIAAVRHGGVDPNTWLCAFDLRAVV